MSWLQVIAIIVSVWVSAFFIHWELRIMRFNFDARIDKLYEILIKNQKEIKQQFYDLITKR